jgi:uncharacterized protein YdeI (YjbR/CyaY-like superfamily)
MGKRDISVDNYISKSADFAKPILNHLRNLVHEACPENEEKIKWSFPCFDYKGMLCSMAAFKQHCAFNFWKSALMKNAQELKEKNEHSMGHLGKITSLKDLPNDEKIIALITEAMKINDDKIKLPPRKKTVLPKDPEIPKGLQEAFLLKKTATSAFNKLSPSQKREYIEWINEAKTDETKSKRIALTIEWVEEGKSRNWKYVKK